MTIKDTIKKELLDCADDTSGLEGVFKRYGHSKGPLYAALLEATAELRGQYEGLVQETQRMRARHEQAESETHRLEEQRRSLKLAVKEIEKDVGQKERRLSEVQALLDAVDKLEGQGFGKDSLEKLFNLLADIATAHGQAPEAGATKFFEVVDKVGGIVSMELQAQRFHAREEKAKAQAERWEAEAKRQEARTRARAVSIDIVEQILEAGVKATDIPVWQKNSQQRWCFS